MQGKEEGKRSDGGVMGGDGGWKWWWWRWRTHLDSRPNRAPDACNGKRKKRGKKYAVSSFVINILSPVCNCTDTTQVATDRQTDGFHLVTSLICIGACTRTTGSHRQITVSCAAFPVFSRQDLQAEFYADAQLCQRTCSG